MGGEMHEKMINFGYLKALSSSLPPKTALTLAKLKNFVWGTSNLTEVSHIALPRLRNTFLILIFTHQKLRHAQFLS